MLITLVGIVTEISPLQPSNAERPMFITVNGIVTSPFTPAINVLPSLEQSSPLIAQNSGFSGSTTKDISPLQ